MKRGEIYLADLNPVKGSEQAGQRPVLIFEDDRLIPATLTVVVIPFTTNLRMAKLPTCVFVAKGEGGLTQDSIAICHQIRALDKKGLLDFWGTLPKHRIQEIEKTLRITLGIK